MVINPGITLDPSDVHDYRHIRPAADTGARLLSYQLADFAGSVVGWVLVVVMLAVAVLLLTAALRPRNTRAQASDLLEYVRPPRQRELAGGVAG